MSPEELAKLLKARANPQIWEAHPIICASAVLPTVPIDAVISLVVAKARLQRSSLAFWAHPTTGKTWCITALVNVLAQRFPGCGIVRHEAKSNNKVIAEGSFISDILHSLGRYQKIQHTLADKREQLRRAIYALGAEARRIFFLLDEAQELAEQELRWLKELINWLVERGFWVTTIMFGQVELIELRDYVYLSGRSDLAARFFRYLLEFEPIRCYQDLAPFTHGCDEKSEYPLGEGWSYTQFLWPLAFANGFRPEHHTSTFWQAFGRVSPLYAGEHGVCMFYIAAALAQLADATRDLDAPCFQPRPEDWADAIVHTGYRERPRPLTTSGRLLPKASRGRKAE